MFTIAIPTYNSENIVEKALLSALNQKYKKSYEILIVDNASSDKTIEKVKKVNEQGIRVVVNKTNVGLFGNHNECLKHATGDYVLFCHSDDVLMENALSILDNHISSLDFPEKFIVWGRSLFRDFGVGYQRAGGESNKVLAGMNAVKPFLYGGLTPSGTCYSRKSFLDLGGFLNCNHRLSPADWTTMMMLALDGFEFKMIDRLYFQRTFASTLVTGTAQSEVQASWVDAISELQKKLPKEKIDRLIEISQELDIPPLIFYFGCVINGISCGRIRNILIKKIIKHPLLLRNGIVRKIFLTINRS